MLHLMIVFSAACMALGLGSSRAEHRVSICRHASAALQHSRLVVLATANRPMAYH